MKQINSWLTALLLVAATAYAEPAPEPGKAPAGAATRTWLELQRSGQAASKQPQPMSGEAMARVHQRYLKGFEHPQPMYYEHAEAARK